jgi:A/G-specific adenine glycosylase
VPRPPSLRTWYARHGRHDLAWRATRDRWFVLMSEVMLHQTQVPRVAAVWPEFSARFPAPAAMAAAGPAEVIRAWGRLGYPRRARHLHDTAVILARDGWPDDLRTLPGVGRYTAAAVLAQADDVDVPAVDVNIRRVAQRVSGRLLTDTEAEAATVTIGAPLRGRDRLLALMDVGAMVCRPREPDCPQCPLRQRCATTGVLAGEVRVRQARFEGSFRQRRGQVMARLREGPVPVGELDAEALAALEADGLARVSRGRARLP